MSLRSILQHIVQSVSLVSIALAPLFPSIAGAEDLTLKDGKVYKNIGKIKDEGDRIKVPYDEGQALILKKDVTVEFLEKHGISTSTTPIPKPATQPEPTPGNGSKDAFDTTEVQSEDPSDIDLTIASILGKYAHPVELKLLHYEKNTFICEGVYFDKEMENKTVQTGTNSFTRQPTFETRQVEVWKRKELGNFETPGRLRVFGLPQTLVGEKTWRGQLWLGGQREATIGGKPYLIREAFTTRELAVQYMKEHGIGKIIE